MSMGICPTSGLFLPKHFIDEKTSLKKVLNDWVDKVVMTYQHIDSNYFLTFHAKFSETNSEEFCIDSPKITYKLPPFISNSMVYWVSNKKGICELLWIVPPKKKGDKLSIEFNKEGVAYLQAKGAMPS